MNIKDVAARAVAYFGDVYGSQFGHVMIEEVERDSNYWYITLGYDLPLSDNSILGAFQRAGTPPRGFKIFKIDALTGDVVSMKIREVQAVE